MGVTSSCCEAERENKLPKKKPSIRHTNPERLNDEDLEEFRKNYETEQKQSIKFLEENSGELDTKDKDKDLKEKDVDKILNVYFEKFELAYRYIDDFGLEFEPNINLTIVGSSIDKFHPFKNISEELEGSDKIKSTDYQTGTNTLVTLNTQTCEQNNNYLFNKSDLINLDEVENWHYSRLKISLNNINNKNQSTPILVASCYLDLYQFLEISHLEGKVPMFNKFTKLIGYLYLRLRLSQNKDASQDDLNISNLTDEDTYNPVGDKRVTITNVVAYHKLSQNLVDQFQINEKESDVSTLNNRTVEKYAEVLIRSISKNNDLFSYEILYLLNSKFDAKDDEFVIKFFTHLKKNQGNINIYDYPSISIENKNLALIKLYFTIIFKILFFCSNNKQFENLINIEKVTEILFDSYEVINSFLNEMTDSNHPSLEEKDEMNEIIVWILNTITLLTAGRATPENKENKIPTKTASTSKLPQLSITAKLGSSSKLPLIHNSNQNIPNNSSICFDIIKRSHVILENYSKIFADTDICSLICKIFKKCILEIFDSKSKLKEELLRLLVLDNTTNKSFLDFLELTSNHYYHYPEVYANILLIIKNFAKLNDNEVSRKILDTVKMSDLTFNFSYYRFKFKNISKNINCYYYEYLASITDSLSINEVHSSINKSEMRKIGAELSMLFETKIKDNNFKILKNLKKFLSKKSHGLHESLSKIGKNLSNRSEGCSLIANDKSYFIPHIIEVLLEINKANVGNISINNKKTLRDVELCYVEIVENSLTCLNNILMNNTTSKNYFVLVMGVFRNSKSQARQATKSHIASVLKQIPDISPIFSSSNTLKASVEEFLKNIDSLLK